MKIKWNIDAFQQIRRDPAVAADVDARAERVAAAAGDGFEASSYEGRSRHRASVITATAKAMAKNSKHNVLLRSLDAGR